MMCCQTGPSAAIMKLSAGLLALAALLPVATALPSGDDPKLTLSQTKLDSVLACPGRSSYQGIKKPLLLIPGTGTTGPESWDNSVAKLAPGWGFEPCYISPAPYMLNSSSLSVEYFVNAVRRLYSQSGQPVPVVGWSQGNIVIQSGLTFFPSIRSKVDRFVSLAGDFRGTTMLPLLTGASGGKAPPSVWQQAPTSQFLLALKDAGGLDEIVPTTSVYSSTDEVVQPETDTPSATSYLHGAVNVLEQKYCKGIFIAHGGTLFSNMSMSITKYALQSPGKRWDGQAWEKGYCGGYVATGLKGSDKDAVQAVILTDLGRITSKEYLPFLRAGPRPYLYFGPPFPAMRHPVVVREVSSILGCSW